VDRPVQELKGFAKVELAPGATATVTITLGRRAFAVWDVERHDWVVEGGAFELRVGASSREIRSTVRVEVAGDPASLRPTTHDPGAFEQRYGRPLPPNRPEVRGQYTVDTPLGDLRHPVARLFLAVLVRLGRASFRSAPDNPMVHSLDRILAGTPARMLPMITEGRLGARFVRGLVWVANHPAAHR
jgi:beta-glucosidase